MTDLILKKHQFKVIFDTNYSNFTFITKLTKDKSQLLK